MITVIIPSKGRESLNASLVSLKQQTNPMWRCIVSFDGITKDELPHQPISDNRIIHYYNPAKIGDGFNGGGAVRNKAIDLADTNWICFLDDDDSFQPNYMEAFYSELDKNPNMDVCIFKMRFTNGVVLPPEGMKELTVGQVGISFAVKLSFLNAHGLRFTNGRTEDFHLLKQLEKASANIHFSNHVVYNVGFSSI